MNKEMQKQIRSLPIYVGNRRGNVYHILNDKVPKNLQRTKKVALSIIETRPDIIGEIKRNKPKYFIFEPTFEGTKHSHADGYTHGPLVHITVESPKHLDQRHRMLAGHTAIHELEHVRVWHEVKDDLKLIKKSATKKRKAKEEEAAERRAFVKSKEYYVQDNYIISRKNPKKGLPEDDIYASFIRTTY